MVVPVLSVEVLVLSEVVPVDEVVSTAVSVDELDELDVLELDPSVVVADVIASPVQANARHPARPKVSAGRERERARARWGIFGG